MKIYKNGGEQMTQIEEDVTKIIEIMSDHKNFDKVDIMKQLMLKYSIKGLSIYIPEVIR